MTDPGSAHDLVAGQIRRQGPLAFDEVMRLALYDPGRGFYTVGGRAGRRGDFITSPEVGPLFGAVVARLLDQWWEHLGEPDPFLVIEAGAGVGTLARSVLHATPNCAGALTYVLVEQSVLLRERQTDHLSIMGPELALPPAIDGADGEPLTATGRGPRVVSLADLPSVAMTGVVLANELLDNLPIRLIEWCPSGWCEVRVGLASDDATLVEFLVPATDDLAARAGAMVPDPVSGTRFPIQDAAADWVARAHHLIERGCVVAIDYADHTASMAQRPMNQWLRTYRGHERGGSVLDSLGHQDITCEVAIDQMDGVVAITMDETQAEFLTRCGIDDLVEEGRRVWAERAAIGDLAAMKARSRVREAEALVDPTGLGAFRVLTWVVS